MRDTDLVRSNPFDSLRQMRAMMDRMFPWNLTPATDLPAVGDNLALDVYDDKGDLVVKAALPGVKPADVKVAITDGVLEIDAHASEDKEVKESDFYLKEYVTSSWHRSLRLPGNAKVAEAKATYKDGNLILRIPRTNGATPRSIEVKVG